MRLYIVITLILAANLKAHPHVIDSKGDKPLTFEVLRENKIHTKLLLREVGILLTLPKTWNLSSPDLQLSQAGIEKLKKDAQERFNPGPGQEWFVTSLGAKKTDGWTRIFSNQKTERFSSNLEPHVYDIGNVSIDLKVFLNTQASALAAKAYEKEKRSVLENPKATISAKIQNLTINQLDCYHYRTYEFDGQSHYWIQVDDHVLFLASAAYSTSTEKQVKELQGVINRIQKANK